MNNDTLIDADPDTDKTRFFDARDGVIWDPRADMDDDGDIDDDDVLLWSDADDVWPESAPTVAQAFSDVGNPFMFQGVPHFALDTADDAESATLPLNHHRARFADPVTGRWGARDPIAYADGMNLYEFTLSSPIGYLDPFGLQPPATPPPKPPAPPPEPPPGWSKNFKFDGENFRFRPGEHLGNKPKHWDSDTREIYVDPDGKIFGSSPISGVE